MEVLKSIKNYWNWRAEEYDQTPGHSGFEEEWRKFMKKNLNSENRILDVGTGTGFLALLLAEMGYEVVGIDISEEMLKVAKKKAEEKGLKVKFLTGNAENLDFKENEFDAVVSRHLLWTLPNPEKAVSEWRRVARKKVIAIDGVWMSKDFRSKISRFFGQLGIVIIERKNVFKLGYSKEVREKLPYYGGVPRDIAIEIFRRNGFEKVEFEDLGYLKEMFYKKKPFHRLAWAGKDYYAVLGVK